MSKGDQVAVDQAATQSRNESTSIQKWEDYWMAMAVTAGRKSKDPRCQVGAVIVRDDVLCSTGFNGLARDLLDDPDVLADAEEKLKWICHAEFNAIVNAARHGVALKDATIYVTKFPCFACCNAIIQAGIREIYTTDHKFWGDDPFDSEHTRKQAALNQAGIKVRAPNHPSYSPKPIGKSGPSAGLTEVATPPSKRRRKATITESTETPASTGRKRTKSASGDQAALFPARQPIPGGKSGT